MTIDWIINLLKMSGINSKRIVLESLEFASLNELIELRRSITEKINLIQSTRSKCEICSKPLNSTEKELGICSECLDELTEINLKLFDY